MKIGWKRNSGWIFLVISLGVFSSLLSVSATSQAQRARQVRRPEPPVAPQAKPTPKPTTPPASVQNPPKKADKPPAQEPGEVLRISSNLVAVPVSVTDTSGQPVR